MTARNTLSRISWTLAFHASWARRRGPVISRVISFMRGTMPTNSQSCSRGPALCLATTRRETSATFSMSQTDSVVTKPTASRSSPLASQMGHDHVDVISETEMSMLPQLGQL